MKKIISAALAVLCALSVFAACGNSEAQTGAEVSTSTEEQSVTHSFRNVDWGMTIDEVKAAETAEFESEKENKSLRYKNIEMFGQKFDLTYAFDISDGLYSAVYGSPNILNDEAKSIEKSIIDTLTEKYGKGDTSSPLYNYVWYSGDTKISMYIGTAEESVNLTFFRIWYEFDSKSDQRNDNGNL